MGGGWFSGGPKWTTQEATVTADAYIYLQAEHQDDAKFGRFQFCLQCMRTTVRPITALLTQSTVTLASEGDSEILTIKPVKQSGMFTSAPKSLQLKFPLDGQHLGGRWLELLHRVQCQARNREELLAATVGGKSSKSHRDSSHRSSDDGNMEAPDHQQDKA
ncbi:Ankyrin Repeat [Perkinsus olseni]|uniref:Ankyrin Repeat n=1 Tax=Perkinsus olseni TaxID=32597 RepID=A0A7J6PAA6_PEROL|nr:Ankyrin Repeat [Perkinsus olseni]